MDSQREYENRSLHEANRHLTQIESAPLSERKEAQAEFLEVIKNDPALLAERLSWLIDGNYGYGEMMKAKQIIASPRVNREAALTQLVAAYEWQCPPAMAVAAWKKLDATEKRMLSSAIEVVIEAAEADISSDPT